MARIFNASTGTRPTGWAISRASTATYLNSSGVIATASANAERLNYNTSATLLGLLIEPAATNLVLQCESMSTTPWATFQNGTGTISETANAATAPDGTTTATLVSINRSLVSDYAEHYQVLTSGAGTFVHSVWFKANGAGDVGKTVQIAIYDGTTVAGKNVTLTAAWQRIDFSMVAAASIQVIVGYVASTGLAGALGTGAVGLLVWGDQAETGTTPTSLIPTTTVSATRAADDYSFTLAASATQLTYTFDDASTQVVTGLTGGSTYHIPTSLTRANVLYIDDNSTGGGGGTQTVNPSFLTDGDTFFAPTVTQGSAPSQSVSPPFFTDADSFFAPTVSQGAAPSQSISLSLFSDGDTFFAPTVSQGSSPPQNVGVSFTVDADGFFGPVVSGPPAPIVAPLFNNASVIYAPSLSGGIPVVVVTGGNRLLTPLVSVDHDIFGYKPGHRSTGSNSSARGREAPARRPYAETWD